MGYWCAGDVADPLAREDACLARERAIRNALFVELTEGFGYRGLRFPDVSHGEFLYLVLDAAIATRNADFGNIQLFDAKTKTLSIVAQRGFDSSFLEYFRSVEVDDASVCAEAMRTRSASFSLDIANDTRFTAIASILEKANVRAVESRPVFDSEGTLLAVVSVHFRRPFTR